MPDIEKSPTSYDSLLKYFLSNSPLFVVMGVFGVLAVNINLITNLNNRVYNLPSNSKGYLAYAGLTSYNDLLSLTGTVAALIIFLIISAIALKELFKVSVSDSKSNYIFDFFIPLIAQFAIASLILSFLVLTVIIFIMVFLRFDMTIWTEIIKLFALLFLSIIFVVFSIALYQKLKKVRYLALTAVVLILELAGLYNYYNAITMYYLVDINYEHLAQVAFFYSFVLSCISLTLSFVVFYSSDKKSLIEAFESAKQKQ
jgi:hypothetical protein